MLHRGVTALKWSLLGELGARLIGPVGFLVLARLLVPADFGVVAAATILISVAQLVCEMGLPKALVQRLGDDDVSADTALWLALGFGVVLMLLLYALAAPAAAFFGDSRVADVLRALAPTMPLGAAAGIPLALLQKRMEFRALFWVRLVSAAVPAVLSVVVALAGGGVWALVAGSALMPALQLLMALRLGRWHPRLRFDPAIASELFQFGRWALVSALLGWGYTWLDTLLVGRFLGSHEMGLYRTGNTIVTLVFGTIFAPLAPILYSLFSRAQLDVERLRGALGSVVRVVALVSLPLAVALFWLRDLLALHVLGDRWRDAGPIIGWLALTQGVTWLVAYNGELLRAVGRPQAEAWVMGGSLVVYAAGFWFAVQYGLEVLLQARFGLALFGVAVQVLALRFIVGVPLAAWRRPVAAAAACLGALWISPMLAAACVVLFWCAEWPLLRGLHGRWREGRNTADTGAA